MRDARTLRVLVAQLNLTVGDVGGNAARIVGVLEQARASGVDVAVFPELAVCGYPPEDLLMRPAFLAECEAAITAIAGATRGLTALVGFPDRVGDDVANAAAVLHDGALADVYHKAYLPNYGVFDEERYFDEGRRIPVYERGGAVLGVSICEDIWYAGGPPEHQATAGAEVLINLSASPFVHQKHRSRTRMVATRAADSVAYVVYCNLVGGQDELVFDGNSLVVGPDGEVLARGASFAEDVFVADLPLEAVFRQRLVDPRGRKSRHIGGALEAIVERRVLPPLGGGGPHHDPAPTAVVAPPVAAASAVAAPPTLEPRRPGEVEPLVGEAEIWAALVLGTRDYVRKNGFDTVVIGLSGGIDSALTAVVALDALGPEHVVGVAMPTRYNAPESLRDARALTDRCGMRLLEIGIDGAFQAFLDMLAPAFEGRPADVTEENLQSRIRGTTLMALSNKHGWLVLTTGNKSETAVGYSTLYGDTAGAFAPLQDVAKTRVYALARWRNAQEGGWVIPAHSIERAPSAELRPNQTDQDTLPPYDLLDAILERYVEEEMGPDEIAARGFDEAVVRRVARMVERAEFKRRQNPPGIKITARAFGRDRRMPITKAT